MPTFNTLLPLSLLAILLVGCSQSQNTFIEEANAICTIYSPQTLQQATAGKDAPATFEHVNQQLRETIKSEEMQAIFEKLAQEGTADFYAALQKEISALLGAPWTCEDAKNFYAITWQPVAAAQGDQLIEVTVVEGQYYRIDHTEYPMANTEDLKIVFDTLSDGQPYTVHLSIPAGTSDATRDRYLEPLRKVGVKQLTVVEGK